MQETYSQHYNLVHWVIYETAKGNEFSRSIYAGYYPLKNFAPFLFLQSGYPRNQTDLSPDALGILYAFLALRPFVTVSEYIAISFGTEYKKFLKVKECSEL